MFGLPDIITPITKFAAFLGFGSGVNSDNTGTASSPIAAIPSAPVASTSTGLTGFQWGELILAGFGILLAFRLLKDLLV